MRVYSVMSLFLIVALSPFPRTFGQETSVWTFMPGSVAIPPLMASYHEPRVGVRKEIRSTRLKLDIGSTLDVLEYSISSEKKLRLGIDFFTYALTTSSQGLRLQVDAVDGYFGGHISYRAKVNDDVFGMRLRLLHLSAHFLDGHFDNTSGTWKDGRDPLPFTKDFGEMLGRYEWNTSSVSILCYSGFSYATLVRPVEIKRLATLHGIEVHSSSVTGPVFAKPCNLYAAANFTLTGIPTYVGTTNVEAGAKFGEWSGTGLRLYLSYYSGLSIFNQYYDVRESQWGAGFAFDFW